ncbi:MAG: glycerol-3-phosphate acyltransferase [Patescibacteria group bacterium]
MSIFWIAASYLLGSLPFGFIIGKLSGKNVLEVGWKKTSGSNVYKNVGKKQGILTAVLDVAKGFLAVALAQKMGFSQEVQILSGAAAVAGHNWSVFLRFSGGRGIATLAGAFLALFPGLFLWAVLPAILLSFIWNASIGTLLFFAVSFFMTAKYDLSETLGFFTGLNFAIVMVKRLSPIKEIELKKGAEIWKLVRNRLIFDNDEFLKWFRISRLLAKENKSKTALAVKIISAPIVLPSKFSWQVAKFSAKMAKKPIDLLLKTQEKVVTEIKVNDFKKMMIASAQKIVIHQEEINRINVFPVADKDTGYNFAATLLGVEGLVSQKKYATLRQLAEDIKEAAMVNARGNAGMIFTGYLIEVLERIKHLDSIDAFDLSFAMRSGIRAARNSVAKPVEGTILDVVSAAGNKAYEVARQKTTLRPFNTTQGKRGSGQEKNIIRVLEEAYSAAQSALKETPEKLAVLKQNNVVDAGGLGFVKILEAWIENLKGESPAPKIEVDSPILQTDTDGELQFRYEAVLSFKKPPDLSVEKIQEDLAMLGDSLEVIEMDDTIKLHIHTNQPEAVVDKFKAFPEFEQQTEDMSPSTSSGQAARKPLGLVVDQIADLPREFLEKYEILEVPFTTRFPDGEIITSKEDIYLKIKEAIKKKRHLPTTSAPTFKNFLSVYQQAFKKFEKFLVITISSKLSGAFAAARIARSIYKKPDKLNIYVFDCASAEVGEGLAAFYAQDLILQGRNLEEVTEELKAFCPKITLIACVDDFRYVIQGGRVHLPKILIWPIFFAQKIGLRLMVGLKKGGIKLYGLSLGKNVPKLLADKIDQERKGKEIVAAIAHADSEAAAEELKAELGKRKGIKVLFVSSASPVVATHTGPGALIAAFYPIESSSALRAADGHSRINI